MRYDKLMTPCNECPFRKDKHFHLRRSRDIVEDLLERDRPFTCHKTVNYDVYDVWREDEDGEGLYDSSSDEHHHCAGALILLKKTCHLFDNLVFRLAVKLGHLDPNKLDMEASVYDTLEEFVARTQLRPDKVIRPEDS